MIHMSLQHNDRKDRTPFVLINKALLFSLTVHKTKDNEHNSALFNFQSLLTVVLLLICTCAYVRSIAPRMLDKNKDGLLGIFWKCARIGERLSPYVALSCVAMAFTILFLS